MDALTLKYELIKQLDQYGLYKGTTDNSILFTTHFYFLCRKLGILSQEDKLRLQKAIAFLQEKPGLFNRKPCENKRKEDHDNYVALVAASIFEPIQYVILEILNYGEFNFYSYDNTRPYKYSFDCQRQGFDIFLYKVAGGRHPLHWFGVNYAWFIGKIFFEFQGVGKRKDHTSSHLLTWLRFLALRDNCWTKPIKKYWEKKMLDKYGEKWLYEIFRGYHGEEEYLTQLAKLVDPKNYL